jgi:hypothetical protein
MHKELHAFLAAHGQLTKKNIHSRVDPAKICYRRPEKADPHQLVTGQFFCPEQGIIEYIAKKDLQGNSHSHEQAKAADRHFDTTVQLP